MTRDEATTVAARMLAEMRARRDALSPEDAAREAHRPGGMPLEQRITLIQQQRYEARQQGAAA